MTSRIKRNRSDVILLLLVLYSVYSYSYLILRYGGYFYENDTSGIYVATQAALEEGSFTDNSQVYPNGIAYIAFQAFLTSLSGINTETLQLYILPLLSSLITVVVYVSFRALTNDTLTALIATGLLSLQSDFLFVTWRGSHEKITWTFTLTLIFLLSKSLTQRRRNTSLVWIMSLFYVIAFALISSNMFFGNSFVTALIISFTIGTLFFRINRWVKVDINPTTQLHVTRLAYISVSCLIFTYIILFYLYPPSIQLIRVFDSLTGQLQLFLFEQQTSPLDTQTTTSNLDIANNPYQYITEAWTSIYIYFTLSMYTWIILLVSGIIWLYGLYQLWRTRTLQNISWPTLFLWLLYPAFAIQILSSAVADQVKEAGNLQVRLIIPVILVGIPIVAIAIRHIIYTLPLVPRRIRFVLLAMFITLAPILSITTLLKASQEPIFNNYWIFALPSETNAGNWAYDHLREGNTIWTGIDNRIADRAKAENYQPNTESGLRDITFDGWSFDARSRYVLQSQIEQMRWARTNFVILNYRNSNIVYDNGQVQIYHLRPASSYQR